MAEKEEVIHFNFHNDLKKMYLHPKEFFKSEKEDSYQSLLRMFVLFYLSYLVISQIIIYFYNSLDIFNAVGSIVGGVLFSVVIAFVLPGILYLLLILFGSNKEFFKVYKTGIYILVLWVFYSIILLFVSTVIPFDTQGLQVTVTGSQNLGMALGALILFLKNNPISLLSLIISLAVNLHILVFGIKALTHYQKISNLKSSIIIILGISVLFIIQTSILVYLATKTNIPIV